MEIRRLRHFRSPHIEIRPWGNRLARLGEQLNQQIPLLTFGVPALEQLTRECHEASHLAILQGTEIVYISPGGE